MKLSFASLLDYMSRLFEMLRVVLGSTVHSQADFLLDISILLEARKVGFRMILFVNVAVCTGVDCVLLSFVPDLSSQGRRSHRIIGGT